MTLRFLAFAERAPRNLRRAGGALGSLALLHLASCSPGAAANAARVEAPSAKQALGDAPAPPCTAVPAVAQTLVIDLPSSQRTDLELAMKSGRAVVHYGCDGMRVLSSCELKGDYRFAGVSLKEEVVQLKSQDEIRASLPISGATLAGGVARGTSLDLATAMVGRSTALGSAAAKSELTGACEGATHFVRAVYVGAFAMRRGSGATVTAAAALFGGSADAKSESDKQTNLRDGSLDACKKSAPDSVQAPADCHSAIRVELFPIGDARPGADTGLSTIASPCPEGYAFAAGRCTTAAKDEAFLCAPTDEAACRAQCKKGSAASCYNLAHLLTGVEDACKGKGEGCIAIAGAAVGAANYPQHLEGAKLYEKACADGVPAACFYVGSHISEGLYGYAKSDDKADASFDRGCSLGHALSCAKLAERLETRDRAAPRAVTLSQRACDLGYGPGCFAVVAKYLKGQGTPKNPAAARAVLSRTCTAGDAKRCAELGVLMLDGTLGDDAKKDVPGALAALGRGCDLKREESCRLAAMACSGEWGVAKDAAKARSYFDRACAGAAATGKACVSLAARLKK
ncbi:MAG: sel1 repeat family protein [Myxococcales bacterium]|nr:sel1 repeat family protein [Myxococcales bacterium]MBL0193099.1 sel1 repeat family protein [Myxococcales bacterium]HQY59998.1 tetratricopeptide repeat protein [Polyangiaceae bacterium]